jgi:hypothetical protein
MISPVQGWKQKTRICKSLDVLNNFLAVFATSKYGDEGMGCLNEPRYREMMSRRGVLEYTPCNLKRI